MQSKGLVIFMYSINVPIMNASLTDATRQEYLKLMQEAKADRVLLVVFGYGTDAEADKKTAESLKKNISFLRAGGIRADVWIGETIGHGGPLSFSADHVRDVSRYASMVNLLGQSIPTACCPLHEGFRKRIGEYVAAIAESGAEVILLDDDFRMSQHGPEFCCACDLHMKRIADLCGEDIRREDLKELAFSRKANKYRNAWLASQKEALMLLASEIRRAVDMVAPHVRVGFCTAHSVWGVDGTDPIEIAEVLAGGNTQPFVRLHGAPYWSVTAGRPMPTVIEMARLLAFYCEKRGAEMLAEGDVYPRPRYNVPASVLEMYDAAMRIDGRYDGILKYMVDYNSSPTFETGYITRHIRNAPLFDQLSRMFEGKKAIGVNVSCHTDLFRDADLEMGVLAYYPRPLAGAMLSLNSIPTVYGTGGICHAVFGEEARHVALGDIRKGAVLDAVAAKILRDRGIDVGLSNDLTFENAKGTFLKTPDETETACVTPTALRYAKLEIKAEAKTVCHVVVGERKEIFSYIYENADGARFLVFCFDSMALPENTGMHRGYLQQRILKQGLEWISGEKLPVYIGACPDLYVMCKENENGMAVALFNFFADSVEEPVIHLHKAYRNIRFLNCDGTLDGDKVTLSSPIAAYSFVAFEVL